MPPKPNELLSMVEAMKAHLTKELTEHVFPLPEGMTDESYKATMDAFSNALGRAWIAGYEFKEKSK